MPFKRSCGFPARACALMLALLLFASGALAEPGTLEVAFLNAGKADAFVLLTENSAVVIDTGENSMGDALVDFLLSAAFRASTPCSSRTLIKTTWAARTRCSQHCL